MSTPYSATHTPFEAAKARFFAGLARPEHGRWADAET